MARTKQLIYKEPRDIEGDPYEVAGAAARQAETLISFTARAVNDVFVMARVAEMERQDEPDGAGFEQTPVGIKLKLLRLRLEEAEKSMRAIAVAAAYDPKAKVPA